MHRAHSLAAAHVGVAIAAFAVASAMGVLQALSMADVSFPIRSESLYYLSLTAHGVLMALVFTTFFVIGIGYVVAQESLGRIVGAVSGGSASGWRRWARSLPPSRSCAARAACSTRSIRRCRRIRSSTSAPR